VTHDTGEPAIRVLPADDVVPGPNASGPRSPRWLLLPAVLLGVFAVLYIGTRPVSTPERTTTTQSPPLAEVEAKTLDFRTAADSPSVASWEQAHFDNPGQVNDLIRDGDVYLAAGSGPNGAQVWWSTDGTFWEPPHSMVLPGGKSTINRIAAWGDTLVALGNVNNGVGVWTSSQAQGDWEYQGELADGRRVIGVAAGPQLLAITNGDGEWLGWVSSDGIVWKQLDGLVGLDTAQLLGLTSDGAAYYAYGATTSNGSSHAAIYRSEDGVNWQPVGLSDVPGAITDLETDNGRLLALGSSAASGLSIWQSTDRTNWERLGAEDPALLNPQVSFAVTETSPGDNPAAIMRINDNETTVTVGTTIDTDIGEFVVEEIRPGAVEIRSDTFSEYLRVGHPVTRTGSFSPDRVAVEGPRLAIVGELLGASTPVVWTSMDDGRDWSRGMLPGSSAGTYQIGAAGDSVSVLTSDGAWKALWDTGEVKVAAVTVVQSYIRGVSHHDVGALLQALPAMDPGTTFEVPSLAHESPGWWDEAGNLDSARVADTSEYLAAVGTSVTTGLCTSVVSLGTADLVDVSCPYTVNSTLLQMFGITNGPGKLEAVVRDGVLTSVELNPAPAATMWDLLSTQVVDAGGGQPLVFTAASAQQHLDVATRYLDGLLQPGETRTVETVLGTMQWSWLQPEQFNSFTVSSLVWSPLGFTLAGDFTQEHGTTTPALFTSPDGRQWQPAPLPANALELGDFYAFHNGVIGSVWTGDVGSWWVGTSELHLEYFDGNSWTPVDIPVADPSDAYFGVTVGSDLTLVTAWQWDDSGVGSADMYTVGRDLSVHSGYLPPPMMRSAFLPLSITAADDGFVAFVTDSTTNATSVWRTATGAQWTQVADALSLDDMATIWNIHHEQGRFLAAGESYGSLCSRPPSEGGDCGTSLWTSPDATEWRQVRTTTNGVVAATDLGSGPLGLAAFGPDAATGQPLSIYLSRDGETWEAVPGAALYGAADQWWWTFAPAVGTDTIVLAGASYRETGMGPEAYPSFDDTPTFLMIVGRVIDQ
jgi:hypothetical protein